MGVGMTRPSHIKRLTRVAYGDAAPCPDYRSVRSRPVVELSPRDGDVRFLFDQIVRFMSENSASPSVITIANIAKYCDCSQTLIRDAVYSKSFLSYVDRRISSLIPRALLSRFTQKREVIANSAADEMERRLRLYPDSIPNKDLVALLRVQDADRGQSSSPHTSVNINLPGHAPSINSAARTIESASEAGEAEEEGKADE